MSAIALAPAWRQNFHQFSTIISSTFTRIGAPVLGLQLKRTVNMKEAPPKPTYRCVKTSLKSVAKNNLVIDKLTDAVLCKAPSTGKPPSAETQIIKDTLKNFYEQRYKAYVSEELSCRQHMSTMLDYLSTGVITMYENNIKHSYVEYVERYVNVSWRKKKLVAIIRKSGRNTRSRQDALCCALACAGLRTTCSEAETLSGLSTLPHNHDFLHM